MAGKYAPVTDEERSALNISPPTQSKQPEMPRLSGYDPVTPDELESVGIDPSSESREKITPLQAPILGASKNPIIGKPAEIIMGGVRTLGEKAAQGFIESGKAFYENMPDFMQAKKQNPYAGIEAPPVSLAENIRKAGEERRGKVAASEAQFPKLTTTGDIGGGIAAFGAASKGIKAVKEVPGIVNRLASSVLAGAGTARERKPEDRAANEILGMLFTPETPAEGAVSGLGLGLAGEALSVGAKGMATVGKKLFQGVRRLPDEIIEQYSKNPKQINRIIREKVDDYVPAWADKATDAIKEGVIKLNKQADVILDQYGPNRVVSTKPLKQQAQKALQKIKRLTVTKSDVSDIKELQAQISLLDKLDDTVSVRDANEIKRRLQSFASKVNSENNFVTTDLEKTIAGLSKKARSMVEEVVPEIRQINNDLAKSINAQKTLKIKNIFKTGGIDEKRARLILGKNTREEINALQALDDAFGTDLLESKKIYQAARELGRDELLQSIPTGRASLPFIIGGLADKFLGLPGLATGSLAIMQSPVATRPILGISQGIAKAAPTIRDIGLAGAIGGRQQIGENLVPRTVNTRK